MEQAAPVGYTYRIAVRRRMPDGSMEQRVYGLTPVSEPGVAPASGDEHLLLADLEYQVNQGTPQSRTPVRTFLIEGPTATPSEK